MAPAHSYRSSPTPRLLTSLALLAALLTPPRPAAAEFQLNWSGRLQTDIRFRLHDLSVGDWYNKQELKAGVARNDNLFKLKLVAEAGRFTGVAEVDFAWYGYALELDGFEDIYRRELVDAFRIEARAVYVEATDLFVRGLDLRVGQQVVNWGAGDQFNPTNMINPLDLEDPILFGELLSNVMLRADYNPFGSLTFSAVMVPIFRPALLPRSAPLGLAISERLPFTDEGLRHRIHTEQWLTSKFGYPTTVAKAHVVTPEASFANMQWAFRVAATVADQDLALSYYYGRIAIPQPFINVTHLDPTARCNPADPTDCIAGLLETETGLYFPRVQMIGLNASGELPNPLSLLTKKARGIGYRLELGVFFPQAASIALLQGPLDFGGALPSQPAGEYDYQIGGRPLVLDSKPFVKWAVGLDYTFNRHFYLNVQWVHGFPDEYGAGDFFGEGWTVRAGGLNSARDPSAEARCSLEVLKQNSGGKGNFGSCAREILRPRIGDYLALVSDVKLLDEKLLLRFFLLFDLIGVYESYWDADRGERVRVHHGPFSGEGFSASIFPEVTYNFGHGLELTLGGLLNLGKEHTKFGSPEVGGNLIWTRARFTY